MEILQEWFLPGESDLLGIGLVLILISALIPWEKAKHRGNWFLLGCALIYCLSEVFMAFLGANYSVAFLALFVGGAALSLALGGVLRKGVLALRQILRQTH